MKKEYKRYCIAVIITSVILFGLFVVCTELMREKIINDNLIPYETSELHDKKPSALELNEATFEELMQIEGIGRELAYDILSLREELGKFTSVSQLMQINGMDKETFSFIEEKLYVDEEWNWFEDEEKPDVPEKININTASARELMSLDAITESLARKIVEYREENGDFISINEITDVDGIGDAIFNSIRDYITV